MTAKSTPSDAPSGLGAPARPMTVNEKSAITTLRRKQERRDERMRDIEAQTADGTLVIRQMTREQHDAAGAVARETRARVEARGRARRARAQ